MNPRNLRITNKPAPRHAQPELSTKKRRRITAAPSFDL
jgi:hypothetical protein